MYLFQRKDHIKNRTLYINTTALECVVFKVIPFRKKRCTQWCSTTYVYLCSCQRQKKKILGDSQTGHDGGLYEDSSEALTGPA